jgi:hypothetical protein
MALEQLEFGKEGRRGGGEKGGPVCTCDSSNASTLSVGLSVPFGLHHSLVDLVERRTIS